MSGRVGLQQIHRQLVAAGGTGIATQFLSSCSFFQQQQQRRVRTLSVCCTPAAGAAQAAGEGRGAGTRQGGAGRRGGTPRAGAQAAAAGQGALGEEGGRRDGSLARAGRGMGRQKECVAKTQHVCACTFTEAARQRVRSESCLRIVRCDTAFTFAVPPQVMTVEEMKRRDAYERSQAVKRIQEETERSRQLLEQRKQLQVGGGCCLVQAAAGW